jgi:hypothetical protein
MSDKPVDEDVAGMDRELRIQNTLDSTNLKSQSMGFLT